MKLQYLGDSKDSFKWDYHDFITTQLGFPLLNIVLMMTPDDGGNDGKSQPALFPARNGIIDFCHMLRSKRDIDSIKELPIQTGGSYSVEIHQGDTYFSERSSYFSGISSKVPQVIFLDPDNGFEPEKSINEKHVAFQDVSRILQQISSESVISIFQHHRRKAFPDDFSRIRERIDYGFSTAIYWHSLMFVLITKSEATLKQIIDINKKYAATNPVKVMA